MMLAMACLMPVQNDTWWHLRGGQEMWARGTILLADEWSFTAAGAHWPNHEWLSEVIFYAIYRIAGLPGLTLFAAICITTALALSWRLMAGTAMQRLVVLGVAMAAISPVWTVRPHVFTFVLVMVVLHLVVRRRYWPIPLIFVPWANLHGGVALGIVVLAGAFAGSVAFALLGAGAAGRAGATSGPSGDRAHLPLQPSEGPVRPPDPAHAGSGVEGRSAVKPLALVLAASFVATWVTPLGPSLWWEIPVSIRRSAANRIVEWMSPSFSEPAHLAFWLAAAVLVVTTWARRRSIRSEDHAILLGVALAILPLALRARRNVPPFLLVAVPAITHNLAHRLAGWQERPRRENPRLNAAAFLICSAACAAIVAAAWSRPAARLQWQPIPPAIAAGAEACGDRIYNRYPDGGPLIWFAPEVRVFIDSRQDPYPVPFVQEYIRMEETGEYRDVFARYGIRCAVLPGSSPVAQQLVSDGWTITVSDGEWRVFSRPS